MSETVQQLRLDAYEASDGPRIVIFGAIDGDYVAFRSVLKGLAGGVEKRVALHDQPFIAAVGGAELTLSVFDDQSRLSKGVNKISDGHAAKYTWLLSQDDWDELSDLIESVVNASTPGHQYLSRSRADDATIVLSRGEYETTEDAPGSV